MRQKTTRNYKNSIFWESKRRLKILIEFRDLVKIYFDNSTLNMISGSYAEEQEAKEARAAINLIMFTVYKIIRHADIKPFAAYTPSLAVVGHGQNIDLILNIFNLGPNNIPSDVAIDYIERAINVYKSRIKKTWLYIPIVTVIAIVFVVMSVALFISNNSGYFRR